MSQGFIYFECPVCGFDSVQKSDFDTSQNMCPMCAADNGRDNRMMWRAAEDKDKPEGFDARKGTREKQEVK